MINKQLIRLSIIVSMIYMINAEVMGQARLKINNISGREMTVKVMRDLYYSDELHEIVEIGPYESKTIFLALQGTIIQKQRQFPREEIQFIEKETLLRYIMGMMATVYWN